MEYLTKGGQAAVFVVGLSQVAQAALDGLEPFFQNLCRRNQRLVVKVLRCAPWPRGSPPDLPVISREALKRVFDVSSSLKHVRSPHVVPYIDVSMNPDGSECRIVMPYFDCDLETWNGNRRHLPRVAEQDLLSIADQLTQGLIALGNMNMSHLDLNATNVLVAEERGSDVPHCVLADLEAAFVGGDSFVPPYTEAFAAPERVQQASAHNASSAERRTSAEKLDVWSLGMLLFVLGARHEFPGLVDFPDYGSAFMNDLRLTPSRVSAAVRRDLPDYTDDFVSLVCLMLNHDPLTRPPLSVVADTINKMKAKEPLSFPLVLGPFELLPLRSAESGTVELYGGSGMYDVHHCTCYCCGEVRSKSKRERSECAATGDMHLPAHMSPFWSVTSACWKEVADGAVPDHMQQPVGSTLTATTSIDQRMVFLYPFACDTNCSEMLVRQGRIKELLQLQGGFACVAVAPVGDATIVSFTRGVVVPVYRRPASRSDLGDSLNLFFASAQPWPSSLTQELSRQGRIHAEVPSLLGTTAKCFCWLLPGERFVLPNKEEWIPAADGGFVFWFNPGANPPHELDRYFPVSASLASKRSSGGAVASSLTQSLNSAVTAVSSCFRSSAPAPVPVPTARGFFLYGKGVPFAPGEFVQYASGIGSKFQISSTGEIGRVGDTFYMGYEMRRLLRAPDAAGYAAFLYADPPLGPQAPQGPPQPGFYQQPTNSRTRRALSHHGFVFLQTVSRQPIGMLQLFITDRDAPPDEELSWFKINTLQLPVRRLVLPPTATIGQLIPTVGLNTLRRILSTVAIPAPTMVMMIRNGSASLDTLLSILKAIPRR